MLPSIRAVFVGDGSLLVRCVDAFRQAGHAVVRVASADDGVLAWAEAQGLSVERVREAPAFAGDAFDILFSVGWLQRLPPSLLQRARRLALNFHDGPLPRYGGLNVTSWALLEGARSHGITWHEMTPQLDAGRIARALAFELSPDETAYSLNAHCYEAGFQAFLQLLDDLGRDALTLVPPAGPPRLYRRDDRPSLLATLDWRRPAPALEALVRALDFGSYPNPLALPKFWCRGRLLVARRARALAEGGAGAEAAPDGALATPDAAPAAPGTVLAAGPALWRVRAGEGVLELDGLQALDGGPLPQPQVGERLERLDPQALELEREDVPGGDLGEGQPTVPVHRSGHPAQAALIQRQGQVIRLRPPLDLDKGDRAAAPGNQVDFPARCLHALCQDAPALAAQIPGGEPLTPPSASFASTAFWPW